MSIELNLLSNNSLVLSRVPAYLKKTDQKSDTQEKISSFLQDKGKCSIESQDSFIISPILRNLIDSFNFHFKASSLKIEAGNIQVEKENIYQFLLDILNLILKIQASGKEIDGIILEREDLKELALLDNGKILKNIMILIELFKNLNRLRGEMREHIWLKLEREKNLVITEQKENKTEISSSLEVQKVNSDSQKNSVNKEEVN